MGFAFNPFTGNFDLKGSGGGGGASYIDGEVAVYTDLPLDGTAALNTAWLVREASGAWLLARKPAGIYIRTATAGVSRDADYTYAGILPDVFSDANFLLYDNDDSSKNLAFQLSGITTGATRVLTVPDANITLENTGHAAKHHTGGTDAIAPNNIGAESLFTASSFTVSGTTTTLSAGRAQIVTIIALSATTINLPTTGNQYGDRLVIRGGSPVLGTITLSATLVSDTITAEGQQRSYVWQSTGTGDRWVLNSVDIHTHAASNVTTGTFDNARINFAAPAAIGSTTPNTLAGTQLALHDGSDTGTFVAASKLTANRTYDLPDASGTLALLETLPAGGTKTYAFFAATGSNQPPATNFAVLDTRNSISVLEFRDTTADDAAIFVGVMPEAAVLSSGLKVRIHWMSDTETSGNVRWQAHFQRCDTGTDLDSDSFDANASNEATGTASATLGAPTITEITCGSGAIDGIVAGDAYRLRITREQSDSTNDTMTCVAQVFAVEVRSAA